VARFLPGVVVGFFIPVPAAPAHSLLHGVVNSGLFQDVWKAAIAGLMFTALPIGTKVLTNGLTRTFDGMSSAAAKLPGRIGTGLSGLLKEVSDLHHEHVVARLERFRDVQSRTREVRRGIRGKSMQSGLRPTRVRGRAVARKQPSGPAPAAVETPGRAVATTTTPTVPARRTVPGAEMSL
jgi:hypothetical protein